MKAICSFLIGIMAIWEPTILNATAAEPKPTATVELIVRSPQGQPLAKLEVAVLPGSTSSYFQSPPAIHATTNDQGMVRFSWPVGVNKVRVEVQKVGYGATGSFEVIEGKTTRPSLPPLIPFGTIEGTVPPEALGPGTYVEPGTYVDLPRLSRNQKNTAKCDTRGGFFLENVPCGVYWIKPRSGGEPKWQTRVFVAPGQRVVGIHFHKMEAELRSPMTGDHRLPEAQRDPIVWATGTVHDELGHVVTGATIFAIVSYDGGLRMYEKVHSVQTDAKGKWTILGEPGLSMFTGTLVVHKLKHPFAAIPMRAPQAIEVKGTGKTKSAPLYDIVLPSHGGNLQVAVWRDGKPVTNGTVRLSRRDGPNLYDGHYGGAYNGPERGKIEDILTPSASTDDSGIAHFSDLVPGEYQIVAMDEDTGKVRRRREGHPVTHQTSRAVCDGVAVRAGETRRFDVAIYQQSNGVRIKVQRPGGQLITKQTLGLNYGSVAGDNRSTSTQINAEGIGILGFETPGLWHVTLKYRDSPSPTMPLHEAPFYEAAGYVAVSPLLYESEPLILTTQRREPGVIVVQLQDAQGKPLRGYVIGNRFFFDTSGFAGSTDDRGEVRFEGVQSGRAEIEAFAANSFLPDIGLEEDPFPEDRELVGRAAFLKQIVNAHLGETRVVFTSKPVGYIRGTIHAPPGRHPADCGIPWGNNQEVPHYSIHYNKKTGEFLVGPFVEGKATVRAYCRGKGDESKGAAQEVTIRSDRVVHIDLHPQAAQTQKRFEPQPRNSKVVVDIGGLSVLENAAQLFRGKVFLADGHTPACGASLSFFVPKVWPPIGNGTTDGSGRISYQGESHLGEEPEHERPGSPTVPVVVAWIPGTCGAKVVQVTANSPDAELKIVLPPPLRLRGKVTVGGKGVQGRNNRLSVLAMHEGKGKLDDLLSRHVSAEMNGAFELPALTPGTYRIQAAMDGVWLSPSIRQLVNTESGQSLSLTLDIGEPGTSSIVRVVNKDGRPVPGVKAIVVPPEGPLTDLLWPDHFVSDGGGAVLIPPLEAAAHKVRIHGIAKDCPLVIPRLSDAKVERPEVPVVLD